MEHILQSLNDKIILNDEIILEIKRNIRRNYPTADSAYRARLLSQALNEILDVYLKTLTDDQRVEVRMNIYRESIQNNSLTVSQRDLICGISHTSLNHKARFLFLSDFIGNHTDLQLNYDSIDALAAEIDPEFEVTTHSESGDFNAPNTLSTFFEHFVNSFSSGSSHFLKYRYYSLAVIVLAFVLVVPAVYMLNQIFDESIESRSLSFVHASSILTADIPAYQSIDQVVREIFEREESGYPDFLRYDSISYTSVIEYLHSRNSAFTKEAYLEVIEIVSSEYDVHPLLLLAIIGQEQGFVPRDNPYAHKILNNPFNVYSSWTNYNTDLRDSCEVAAGTIRNILTDRPAGENPFKWLNSRYAEDPNWWKGVQEIYYTLLAHSTDETIQNDNMQVVTSDIMN